MSRIADQVGRVLGGRYRLLAPIGTGASAHVYAADDLNLRRRVAIKVLHAALADDEAFLRRFRAEAEAVAALRHPNIMNVYDHGEDDGSPYLVLELLGGGSLRSMLQRGHLLSPSQALVVGLDAGRALDYAHRRGLVHRDIKPANLIFDEEGRLCIADFGVARALAEAAWTEPQGAILGTARYASPEQAQGASVDGKADVYALALVLVEAVTGRVPFAADTTIAPLMARLDKQLVAPAVMGPAMGAVVEQASRPDRADRLDAAGLIHGLDRAARSLPAPDPFPISVADSGAASDTSVIDLTVLPSAPAPDDDLTDLIPSRTERTDPSATVPETKVRRRRRWPWFLLTVLLAVGAATGAYALVQARKPSHPVPSVLGRTLNQARAALDADHLHMKVTATQFDDNVSKDLIILQTPDTTQKLKEGSTVRVVVSNGPEPKSVPDLTPMTFDQAGAVLGTLKLIAEGNPVNNETVPKGQIIDWDHKGEALLPGTHVRITY